MVKKYFAGIQINHTHLITKDDKDRLVEDAAKINLSYEHFNFIHIKINKQRYLCVRIDKESKIPDSLIKLEIVN